MKNLGLVLLCSLLMSAHVAAVQVNNNVSANGAVSELSKEIKQLYNFALQEDVSLSTKRNIMCQYLPNRIQKADALNQLDQQSLNSISREVGKLKSDLNIHCAG